MMYANLRIKYASSRWYENRNIQVLAYRNDTIIFCLCLACRGDNSNGESYRLYWLKMCYIHTILYGAWQV